MYITSLIKSLARIISNCGPVYVLDRSMGRAPLRSFQIKFQFNRILSWSDTCCVCFHYRSCAFNSIEFCRAAVHRSGHQLADLSSASFNNTFWFLLNHWWVFRTTLPYLPPSPSPSLWFLISSESLIFLMILLNNTAASFTRGLLHQKTLLASS